MVHSLKSLLVLGSAALASGACTDAEMCPADLTNPQTFVGNRTAYSFCYSPTGNLTGNEVDPSCTGCLDPANNLNTSAKCVLADDAWRPASCAQARDEWPTAHCATAFSSIASVGGDCCTSSGGDSSGGDSSGGDSSGGTTLGQAKPCFPGDATVVRESGAAARLDELKAGDKIKAAHASGALYYDEVSRFSYADYDAEATFVTLATAKTTLRLTAEHRVPVGAACCSDLKKAKDVAVGDTVWTAAAGAPAPSAVTKVGASTGVGVHNPLMKHGGFPVVDGVVTAFESAGVVKFASLTIPLAEAVCEATGTCALVEQVWSLVDGKLGARPIIGGAAGGLTGLVLATGLAVATVASGLGRASKAASL